MTRVFLKWVGFLAVLALVGMIGYLFTPLPESLTQQNYSRIMTNAHGVLLGASIATDEQWRFPLVTRLPEKYIQAVTHFEDKRFFTHQGIDVFAIARAIRLNIEHGRVVSGGSTITMQLARLVSGNKARTYAQKAREMCLALKFEAQLTKQEILQHYASMAPYGGNTVGLSAANWRYFNTRLSDISWSQAALLAVLPNNPSSVHPGRNRDALRVKRNELLSHLNQKGLISDLDLKLSLLEPLPKKPLPLPRLAKHLLDTVKKQYPNRHVFESFIDITLQKHIASLLRTYNTAYKKNNIHNLTTLVIDNETQHVIAYIGNSTGSTLNAYSPALDIIQRPRSSGSLFKPFLFAKMLEQGNILPDSLVEDIPSFYGGYHPKNYDRAYRGLIPAKRALSQSLNVPAVRMLHQYGIHQFKDDLQAAGLTTLWRRAEDYGLSLILGGAETSLWEITNSFSRLALSAAGKTHSKVEASVFAEQKTDKKAYSIGQGASWLTLNSLFEVNRPGVAANWKAFRNSQKIAWKTGTSYGGHDAWAIGTNGRYTIGVWAGNANGEEARQLTGTQTAAPILFDIFSYLDVGHFPDIPYHALKAYEVCEIDSYLPAEGCATKIGYAPKEAHFSVSTQFHKRVHIDPTSGLRVHGLCEKVSHMKTETYFVTPPVHSRFVSGVHTDIKPLPAWRPDCHRNLPEITSEKPFDLEYPGEGARVKIPIELDGKLGRIVVRAHHNREDAVLFWHLNNSVLEKTSFIHEQEIVVNPGWHKLTLVDEDGYKLTRWFNAI